MIVFIKCVSYVVVWLSLFYFIGFVYKVCLEVVCGIFILMVDLFDNVGLMDWFLGLFCVKMFMYGE